MADLIVTLTEDECGTFNDIPGAVKMDWFQQIFPDFWHTFTIEYLLSPLYLASTAIIAWLIWYFRTDKQTDFLRFLLPKEVYFHKSTWLDIKLAAFNTFFIGTGAIAALVILPWVTITAHGLLMDFSGYTATEQSVWRNIFAGIVIFMTKDFCRYCSHYIHHKYRFLWPFHAVHHSAEVMTPITFMRMHPMSMAVQITIISVIVGIVQAIVLFALVGQIAATTVYVGIYAWSIYVFFGAHLRHSHIWVSYGPVMEHILISPAQHQVHHSTAPVHHDKNFGEVFAIWDWMFGTLYVTHGKENIKYGIADGRGVLIDQPYNTLRDALFGPFGEVWEEVAKGTSFDPNRSGDTNAETPEPMPAPLAKDG